MNQDNPYAMNQTCKVCGEPAAGFHFGAFTCEGCKSFFGRSYNNLSSITECKNNSECIINKKNRTACKACRLRKCLMVGMSKSGSRYGRRSNWFKIHCLLQEQQQQAAAAMAAHHNNQQQQQQQSSQHVGLGHGLGPGQKPGAPGMGGVPPPAAAAAALGILGHAGAYPGLYPPRSKEELMMLGLEEYAKHPAASPSVSSPDSHNSDSSIEVNVRSNPLLHLSSSGGGSGKLATGEAAAPPQLRKDLPPFLPLPFPGLGSMPVMPPPTFLPPSHLLFPGYHPALYQHHQGLLKPSAEQQQAAAAAVQHLFNSTNVATGRFTPTLSNAAQHSPLAKLGEKDEHSTRSSKSDTLNNNHIPNGSKAAEELTKRFYLDAVLKSQRNSPPPAATKLPAHTKHDHSISALVTPNSESGREQRQKRRHSGNECLPDEQNEDERSNGNESECGEDLVVSMTPPRSPANMLPPAVAVVAQDNPIDLSMKVASSTASSFSSKCSSIGSVEAADDSDNDNDNNNDVEAEGEGEGDGEGNDNGGDHVNNGNSGDDAPLVDTPKLERAENESPLGSLKGSTHSNSNCSHNTNCSTENSYQRDASDNDKRKASSLRHESETTLDLGAHVKRVKLQMETLEQPAATVKVTTTTPLDLTTKV